MDIRTTVSRSRTTVLESASGRGPSPTTECSPIKAAVTVTGTSPAPSRMNARSAVSFIIARSSSAMVRTAEFTFRPSADPRTSKVSVSSDTSSSTKVNSPSFTEAPGRPAGMVIVNRRRSSVS